MNIQKVSLPSHYGEIILSLYSANSDNQMPDLVLSQSYAYKDAVIHLEVHSACTTRHVLCREMHLPEIVHKDYIYTSDCGTNSEIIWGSQYKRDEVRISIA